MKHRSHFTPRVPRGSFLVLSLGMAACGAPPESFDGAESSSGVPSEPAAHEEAAIEACGCDGTSYSIYDTLGQLTTKVGPSTSTHICWLTGLGQNATTATPYGRVTQQDGSWRLLGMNAEMTCVPQCCFSSNETQSTRAVSPDFGAAVSANPGGGTKTAQTQMWQSDAMPILSGLIYSRSGSPMSPFYYEGAGVQMRSPTETALLSATTHASSTAGALTYAYGYSFFVGQPHSGHVVRKRSYSIPTDQGTVLISVNSGICTLGNVRNMWKPDSQVQVYAGLDAWTAYQHNAGAFEPVCYYFAQDK